MFRLSRIAAALSFALAVAVGVVCSANAQDKITLRIADSLPTGHVIHEVVTKPFMEAMTAATGGQVQFQHYPSEQLGKAKDLLALTQTGVVDIGYVVPSYASDKMPLSAVGELPGTVGSTCQGTLAMWQLSHDGGLLETQEFTPNKVRVLSIFSLPAYQIGLSTTRPVMELKDLEGLKIRATGGALDLMIRGIKAVPVRMAPPEIYESMSRGTVDGALLAYQSFASYELLKMLKAGTVGVNFGRAFVTYSISESKLKSLPENVRDLLAKTGETITRAACTRFDEIEKAAFERAIAAGLKPIRFSEADRTKLNGVFESVMTQWAQELDRRGKPGTEVLNAFKSRVAAVR